MSRFSLKQRVNGHQGTYRIVYSIQDQELAVWVVKIGHRREILQQSRNSILGSQLLLLMKNWLVSHIITEDRKIVLFLEHQGKAESCCRTD